MLPRFHRGQAPDIADFSPAEVCAALAEVLLPDRQQRIEEVLASRLWGLTVVLENPHDPHNGAAVLRTCEAFGLTTVHVVEGVEEFRASRRVTQGCDKWIEINRHASPAACVAELRRQGFTCLAAVPGVPGGLARVDFGAPTAMVFGNEHAGLSDAARRLCDGEFAIPLYGFTRSLNLSVSVALCVAEAASARRRVLGAGSDLDEVSLSRLRARYYAGDVRGAEAILARWRAATHV